MILKPKKKSKKKYYRRSESKYKFSPNLSTTERHGFKIHLPNGKHIPLSKAANYVENAVLCQNPGAWRVEAAARHPVQVYNYQNTFRNALYRRFVWQHAFGGLFRAIFGIYEPGKYWNRDLERAITEDERDSYVKDKKAGLYGIYQFQLREGLRLKGLLWRHDQPPRTPYKRASVYVHKNTVIYCRVNRLVAKPYVDVEARGFYHGNVIVRIPFKQLQLFFTLGKLRRLDDKYIYKLKPWKFKSGAKPGVYPVWFQRKKKSTPDSLQPVPPLPEKDLAVQVKDRRLADDPLPETSDRA